MNVPFMNLHDGLVPMYDEIMTKLADLVENTRFIGGSEVADFEKEFARFCGVEHAVGCANGTDALILALKILDIGPGDTVLVPANTFIATSESITFVGANVDFIDVEDKLWTMNPVKLDDYLKSNQDKNIKAVVPVHLYGQMADMPAIMEIADKYKLKVIEDSAQAHGAVLKGSSPGCWGDVATFSFYPGKNLGAFGDAGALVTRDKELYEKAHAYVNHGRYSGQKYEHAFEGANLRIDTIQAAILRIKLRNLRAATDQRIALANRYTELLSSVDGVQLPVALEKGSQVFHLYVIHIENRDEIMASLKEKGISAGVHYPIPLHLQPAYSYKGYKKDSFPISEKNAMFCLSLPLWPEMTSEQQDYVVNNFIDLISNLSNE